MQRAVPQRSRLPLGSTAAPDHGWFVLRGRRGHYGYCEEIRAYDLSTGAAYVVQECGGLLGMEGPPARDQVGRLPVDALREAAWMTLLAPRVEWRSIRATIPVPESLHRSLPPPSGITHGSGGGWGWASSAQPQLSWTWVDGGRTWASGTLTWPDSDNTGETHADALWRIAEAAFEPGCVPARLPRGLPLAVDPSGVSPIDAAPEDRRSIGATLAERTRTSRATVCRRRGR